MNTTSTTHEKVWNGLDHATAATLLAGHPLLAGRIQPESCGYGDFCLAFSMGDQILRVARHEEASAHRRTDSNA